MFCCFCGSRNSDDANYCHNCGKAVYRGDGPGEPAYFLPREVYVRPNFYTILDDLDLVKNTEEAWKEFGPSIEKLPKSSFYKRFWGGGWDPRLSDEPYHGGFSFYFISPQVIYLPDNWTGHNFASEVHLSASLEPAGMRCELFRQEGEALFEEWFPLLSLQSGGAGYRLSIQITESHWSTVRHKSMFREIADEDVPRRGFFDLDLETSIPAVEVPLAVIPYEEFEVHFEEGACPLRYRLPSSAKKEGLTGAVARRAKARARYGWKGDEIQPDTPITAKHSGFAEHRYCLAAYWHL